MKKIDLPFLRTEHNYDRNAASLETALVCADPSLTRQEFAEESDINYIAEKFALTGEMPVITGPTWGSEYVGIFDFQKAQDQLVGAEKAFMTLPAKVRARFENDPHQLLSFLQDPENRKEAEFLGLVNPPQDAPESPLGAPEPKGKGERPSPAPKAPEAPNPEPKN